MAKLVADPESAIKDFNLGTEMLTPSDIETKASQYADAVERGEETEELSPEEAATLYAEAAKIDAALEKLTERKEQIKAIFRRLPYGTQTVHAESGGQVMVSHNPIFDELRFFEKYPYDFSRLEDVIVEKRGKKVVEQRLVYPNRELYKIAPDREALKRILSEADYKALFNEGQKKVTIK